MNSRVKPGRPYPLGATYDGEGVNFAVFSERATRVDLSLFDPNAPLCEVERFELPERKDFIWHGYVPGLKPGALYGFRAHGPFDPMSGQRFNAHKLLVDPYARAISGKPDWRFPLFSYSRSDEKLDLAVDERDDAVGKPKSVVVDNTFDWEGDALLDIPPHQTVIYEAHVKGFTMRHPGVPEKLRGTYAGIASDASIAHLKKLGITAIELLPVHESVDDSFLVEKGLTNYWGYSTLGFFAPDGRFSSSGDAGGQVNEFKQMVKTLHRAGIEVILDVVYNHTCEGNHLGPTMSLKGLDNSAYYWLKPDAPRYYWDFTGTGNSLNLRHPQTLKLVLDSLRYWVEEMHVDGFRFDLATTLARSGAGAYEKWSPFLHAVHQDPVLSRVKLIAEPWDVGDGGYQVGNFPLVWSEWNGKYRDSMRRYWKGDERTPSEVGWRLLGSSDLFQLSGRRPSASVNFITCHDGFTLHDLVTYDQKHNEANREDNRDGENHNASWNFGVEGETQDPQIREARARQKRNLLATLFLSQGVPMLCAGDEMGRTQQGNNNAYCQDNGLSWLDWDLDEERQALLEFTANLIKLRQEQPVLHRRRFFQGAQVWESSLKDVAWFRTDGSEMLREDWQREEFTALAFLLGGDAIRSPNEDGERVVGDSLLVLLNPKAGSTTFTLPAVEWGNDWEVVVDTAAGISTLHAHSAPGEKLELKPRSLVVLRKAAE